ncbi:MAG: SDR family NAD(P)-dependent oxidoreductase [Elusimicrobia bacterium]|nr:SDR family NAD(P)-dependent oxidoreductase [Elusimicrobiota bacterium]
MSETIALVTGAGKGIGFEIARQLAARGAFVWVTARSDANARKAAALVGKAGGTAEPLAMDVDDAASIRAAARTAARMKRLDVLVNNAGILPDKSDDISRTPPDAFEDAFRTNALGPLLVTQAFLPLLKKSDDPRVINVSSGAGSLSEMESGYAPAYSVSKAALNAVTRKLAATLKGVAVNSMCPGWVRTDMGGKSAPRSVEKGADTAIWLALEAPADLTGAFVRDRQRIPW